MAVTPHMNLTLPAVSSTPGPQWASLLNAALTLIDSHDHSTGKGVSIPGSALSITTDVSHGNANITNVRSVRLYAQSAPLSLASDAGCLYVSGGNLYYNSGAGQQVQITAGGGLNASSIGGIGGDYVTSGASCFYTAASTTFSFWSAANKSANLDCGKVIIREPGVTSPYGITIQSPTGLAAAYSLTLPAALPGSTLPLLVSSAGVMSTAQLTSAHLSASAGITGSQLSASAGITGSQLSSSAGILKSQLAAVGQQVSGSSGSHSATGDSWVDVTNLSITITTSGRPVILSVYPDNSGVAGMLQAVDSASYAYVYGYLRLLRDSTEIAQFTIQDTWSSGAANHIVTQLASIMAIDAIGSGSHTYKVQCRGSNATTTMHISRVVLAAYEL